MSTCVTCGTYVHYAGNPIDPQDSRPFCYNCAEQEERKKLQRGLLLAAELTSWPRADIARLWEEFPLINLLQLIAAIRAGEAESKSLGDEQARFYTYRIAGYVNDMAKKGEHANTD